MTHDETQHPEKSWIKSEHMMDRVRNSALAMGLLCLLAGSSFLTGCGYSGVPLNGTPSTNNWEFAVTPKPGTPSTQALSRLSGSILTSSSGPNAAKAAAIFQATSGCFNPNVISLDGAITNNQFAGRSFGVDGQYLTLTATLDSTQANMTGTYGLEGGCSGGQSGTIVGKRFDALTGTYHGVTTSAPPHTISITTTQGSATGIGSFLISGTATFDTFACFAAGTFPIQGGSVSGSSMDLLFAPSGNQVELAGSIDPAAATMSITKFTVCGTDLSPLTLTRQP